jgi:phosphomannomutase
MTELKLHQNITFPRNIFLFNLNGTLHSYGKKIDPTFQHSFNEVLDRIKSKRPDSIFCIISGSTLSQILSKLEVQFMDLFDYIFAENGTIILDIKQNKIFKTQGIRDHLNTQTINALISSIQNILSNLDIPIKTGHFIDFRHSLINVSPCGRNATQSEKDHYEIQDLVNSYRDRIIQTLKLSFPELPLEYAVGGQTSFDIYPKQLAKCVSLHWILQRYSESRVIFFGNKTCAGGNDYALFSDPRVEIAFTVIGPFDLCVKLEALTDCLFPKID